MSTHSSPITPFMVTRRVFGLTTAVMVVGLCTFLLKAFSTQGIAGVMVFVVPLVVAL